MPLISTLARNMATVLQRLRQNHRQNQEIDLLQGSYSVVTYQSATNWGQLYEGQMAIFSNSLNFSVEWYNPD